MVIGYDLDYTLVHYHVEAWEGAVYEQSKEILRRKGFDVEGLELDPGLVARGLVIDCDLGNVVKVDRYGYVRQAMHGTRMLHAEEVSLLYGRQRCRVDLRESRWSFLNTLFSVASACLFSQLADRVDAAAEAAAAITTSGAAGAVKAVPPPGCYRELVRAVFAAVAQAHDGGVLKARILQDPSTYVQLDEGAALVLLDQKLAGKRTVLITNNDWEYVQTMMAHAYDRFLPPGLTWRALFDLVITNAQKPDFWRHQLPCRRIVDEERGLAESKPALRMELGGVYCGGTARLVEECFGYGGEALMYVGDHIYADTNVAKSLLQWRTCLIMRELEGEVRALAMNQARRRELAALLARRDALRQQRAELLTARARSRLGLLSAWPGAVRRAGAPPEAAECQEARAAGAGRVDEEIAELEAHIEESSDGVSTLSGLNPRWGFLTRVGTNEKTHLMRQMEKYADIYTSRVSNFLSYTPYAYFRGVLQSDRSFLDGGEEFASQGCSELLSQVVESWHQEEASASEHEVVEGSHWGALHGQPLTRECLEGITAGALCCPGAVAEGEAAAGAKGLW